jgi:hypothetical protein
MATASGLEPDRRNLYLQRIASMLGLRGRYKISGPKKYRLGELYKDKK